MMEDDAEAEVLARIEAVFWTLTVDTEFSRADIYTVDGELIGEQWDAEEARDYVDTHNDNLRLAQAIAKGT